MQTIIHCFQVIRKRKHHVIIVASWLIEYCLTGNFGFPVLILNILNLKNLWANFDDKCKIYFEELLVNEINAIIHSDKFSRSYDDLYLGFTFLGGTWNKSAHDELVTTVSVK